MSDKKYSTFSVKVIRPWDWSVSEMEKMISLALKDLNGGVLPEVKGGRRL